MNSKLKALQTVKSSTPFQMVGKGIKSAGKGIGRALSKHFIEPSVKVNKIRDEKMKEMDSKAKAGEFN